ncbi:PHD finger family protein [Citrus sinensis]|uniref:PHD finger family protein n=1 Tax=Citrus sinensis TaxID=2711 RepID=A0ACB8LM98_CITSI|nr:PHD finger family protein [Citrus sinensis]
MLLDCDTTSSSPTSSTPVAVSASRLLLLLKNGPNGDDTGNLLLLHINDYSLAAGSRKRICFCTLGFSGSVQSSKARNDFVHDVVLVEEFLKDPLGRFRVSKEESTVQVLVPEVPQPPPPAVAVVDGAGLDAAEEAAAAVSAQTKRVALQRKAAAAMVAAEDYARRFESGYVATASKDIAGEEQGQSNTNVMCRLCFVGENEGCERARRMLSCKSCGKKYHRNCLKNWAQNRDLFHWSSWKCPSCRICEVLFDMYYLTVLLLLICRRTGDPNKFLFCRRCDAAYHCYCQHPPHKNVSSGPYLCPKHTKCHSCGSNVPGNGLSVRWFLGYTCCDACGRLFVKGNYCPVCLKVYRDSESTPMVCCDVCQRWVHCQCDGISDEKYLQFQVDGNLQYRCPTCRGECYQVRDLEDAVRELWRRKDMADKDLIASLRAAAGLPTEDEIFSISPYSDDEENGPVVLKNEFGRSLKLSLKGVVDKSPKKVKEHGKKWLNKKYPRKKGYQMPLNSKTEPDQSFEGYHDVHSYGNSFGDDTQSPKNEGLDIPSSVAGVVSHTEGVCSISQPGILKHKYVDEVMVSDDDKISRVKFKTSKPHDLDSGEDDGKHVSKSKTIKAKKLVINLGARKINVTNSPRSDASSCQREQDLTTSNGIEDPSLQRMNSKFVLDRHDGSSKLGDGDRVDHSSQSRGLKIAGRGGNVIKFGRVRQEVSDSNTKVSRGSSADEHEPEHMHVLSGKRNIDRSRAAVSRVGEVAALRGDRKQLESRPNASRESNDDTSVLQSLPKDSKPPLRLKFRKPNLENQNSQVSQPEEEKSLIKGQRSKRKRPSPFTEKTLFNEDEDAAQSNQDSLMSEIMDANWILKKLGKDAIGKRVEVHQQSDNSWHKGVVTDTVEGTSTLSITLDDSRVKTLELGKQDDERQFPIPKAPISRSSLVASGVD